MHYLCWLIVRRDSLCDALFVELLLAPVAVSCQPYATAFSKEMHLATHCQRWVRDGWPEGTRQYSKKQTDTNDGLADKLIVSESFNG